MSVGQQQVEFFFTGAPLSSAPSRTDYAGFNLNGVEYKVGECAFLYPEDEGVPPYVGRILSVFHNRHSEYQYCVEVAWFERRAHLESAGSPSTGWEREVVALEETDINPIGCISGKAVVLSAGCYEEASQMAQSMDAVDWLFCRGVYKQTEEAFVSYPELADQMDEGNCRRLGKRGQMNVSGQVEGVADSDDVKRRRVVEEQPAAPVRRTGKLVSGRTCVECGATQTPQWREGPAGPKTLCNACGVRYVRAQQRANKRTAPAGLSRGSCGAGGRQSRGSKAAKAEAAAARAVKAAAQEVSQRPLRQAALMAASKTAQYARTGVFPQDATELDAVGGADLDAARHQHQQRHQPVDQAADVAAAFATAATAGGGGHDPAELAVLAPSRPTTPNCSSFESSGSLHEAGVTVEVVVGPADGDGDCCLGMEPAGGAAYSSGFGGGFSLVGSSFLAPQSAAAARDPTVVAVPAAMVSLTPFGVGMVPADQGGVPVVPAALMAVAPQAQPLAGAGSGLLVRMPFSDTAVAQAAQDAMVVGLGAMRADDDDCGPSISGGAAAAAAACAFDVGCTLGAVEGPVELAEVMVQQQVLSAPVSPSRRSSYGGDPLAETAAAAQPGLYGTGVADGRAALDASTGLMDDNLDSMYGMYGGQLGCGMITGLDDYGPLVEVEVDFGLGPASASGALFDEPYHDEIMGGDDASNEDMGQQLPCPLNREALCTSHATTTLSYGPAPRAGPGAAAVPQPTVNDLGSNNLNGNGAHNDQDDVVQDDAGVRGAADLPCAAALAAAFCSELAPGSEAREFLEALPALSQGQVGVAGKSAEQQLSSSPATLADADGALTSAGGAPAPGSAGRRLVPVTVSAFAAAAAVAAEADDAGDGGAATDAAGPLPDAAVSELVTLGRRASRAATEALAADAALREASKNLEAHQEAARRAAEAAAANLGLLQDCLSSFTASTAVGADSAPEAAAAAAVAGSSKPLQPSGVGNSSGGSSGLVDLRDIGAGYLGTAGLLGGGPSASAGLGVGAMGGLATGVGGFPGYCGFDAGELAVAVHS